MTTNILAIWKYSAILSFLLIIFGISASFAYGNETSSITGSVINGTNTNDTPVGIIVSLEIYDGDLLVAIK